MNYRITVTCLIICNVAHSLLTHSALQMGKINNIMRRDDNIVHGPHKTKLHRSTNKQT